MAGKGPIISVTTHRMANGLFQANNPKMDKRKYSDSVPPFFFIFFYDSNFYKTLALILIVEVF